MSGDPGGSAGDRSGRAADRRDAKAAERDGLPGDGPVIDGRRSEQLATDVREMVPYYVENWDPDEGDVGTTLLSLFGDLAAEVTERLDRVPEKHRVSFYETLGFERRSPQSARLPLAVDVADGAGENVPVPAGTVATAEPPGAPEQPFEVPPGSTFDATPANLTSVFSVDPERDAIYDHEGTIGGSAAATLFDPKDGENLQKHRFYVGDVERLSAGPGSAIRIVIDTDADPELLRRALRWEFYGEREIGGETVEKWYPFPNEQLIPSFKTTTIRRRPPGWVGVEPPIVAEIPGFGLEDLIAWPGSIEELPILSTGPGVPLFRSLSPGPGSRTSDVTPSSLSTEPATRSLFELSGSFGRPRQPRLSGLSGVVAELGWSTGFGWTTPGIVAGEAISSTTEVLRGVETKRNEAGDAVLEFAPHGTLTEKEIDGIESKWIRCVMPDDPPDRAALFDLRFGEAGSDRPPMAVGAAADYLRPDVLLHNDVPLPTGSNGRRAVYPFGDTPQIKDTFAVASTDAFTKPGATVTLTFVGRTAGVGSPTLSWEYFDGEGWSRIPDVTDNTEAFTNFEREGGPTVSFTVPGDLAETSVAGHDGHWIRARLVGGSYGKLEFVGKDHTDGIPGRYERDPNSFQPPTFSDVRLAFDQTAPPDHAVAENNLAFSPDLAAAGRRSFQPFEPVPVDEQTLFLGFDGQLRDGPINVLVDRTDAAYPQTFRSRVRWEYQRPDADRWAALDYLDGTEGLTERGIVGLVFPEDTAAKSAFGRERHWVRARVTGQRFGAADESDADGPATERESEACGRYVATVPPAGTPRRDPPTVTGLYGNAVWVRNRRTIESEVLGSSDGSVDQSFTVANTPVVDLTLWVDELAVLSEGRREALRERWPDRTELETDPSGEPTAFWVRWTREPDLLDSGPEERHYVFEPIEGTVSFGDGRRGKIPPRGTDNVRASYATGGGAAGNVPAGAVSGFQQSLAFVESVTNPLAGDAGADAEPTAAVTDRSARELRDRNRAVAPADVERIAMDASRRLALARCLPAMDSAGEYSPGWVTLLIVPSSAADRPTPSATLRQAIEQAVADRAPVTLVDVEQLVVRGPSYVEASVDADLVVTGGSVSDLESRAGDAVQSFLHPLTGGPDGDGWPFGDLPCRSALVGLLEGVEGVDYVADLTLTFETSLSTVSVAEGEPTPDTSPDALVHSGTHDVSARLAGGGAD